MGNPRIIILDEATANIDTQTELLIQEALKRVLRGRTSIVIAHRLSTVRNADKIVVLDHGRVVEAGRHQELLGLNGVYARLYSVNYGLAHTSEARPRPRPNVGSCPGGQRLGGQHPLHGGFEDAVGVGAGEQQVAYQKCRNSADAVLERFLILAHNRRRIVLRLQGLQ